MGKGESFSVQNQRGIQDEHRDVADVPGQPSGQTSDTCIAAIDWSQEPSNLTDRQFAVLYFTTKLFARLCDRK